MSPAEPAGYSGKPLAEKLGVRLGHTVYVDAAPVGFALEAPHVTRMPRRADVVLTFHVRRATLERRIGTLLEHTAVDGMIWVCWPKQASGVPTDLTGNVVREIGLAAGVVDVKVAAVDATWSGLKFVRRLADRPRAAAGTR